MVNPVWRYTAGLQEQLIGTFEDKFSQFLEAFSFFTIWKLNTALHKFCSCLMIKKSPYRFKAWRDINSAAANSRENSTLYTREPTWIKSRKIFLIGLIRSRWSRGNFRDSLSSSTDWTPVFAGYFYHYGEDHMTTSLCYQVLQDIWRNVSCFSHS